MYTTDYDTVYINQTVQSSEMYTIDHDTVYIAFRAI